MALYRTYRPARLDDVVGQEHVTGPLRRALENDRVHHAYLFSGPRGCGKTSTARILARSLNCEQGPTADPCGVCQSCVDLSASGAGSIDVIELDAASHGGVDDTRDLRERAMFAPASSRYKIYIIDEAHMVTTQGFNALLKLVEEPPPHVRFIFATTEPEKVLPTIRSRTHNYTFRLVSARVLQQHLANVCASGGIAAEPAALALVARAGAGSVRDSLSVLGQVISGAGPEGVTYAEAVAQLGMTDATLLDATVDAMAAHDGATMFSVIDQVIDAGHDPRRFVTDLLERIRDLIVLSNVPNATALGLVDAPEDQIEREVQQASQFGLAELARAADVVSTSLSELKGATAPRLHLELMVARLLLPAADTDEAALRARLDQLERRFSSGAALGHLPEPTDIQPTVMLNLPPHVDAPPAAPAPPRKLSDVAPTTAAEPVAAEPVAAPPENAKSAATRSAAAKPSAAAEQAAPQAPPRRPRSDVDRAVAASAASGPSPSSATPAPAPGGGADVSLEQFQSMWPAVLEGVKAYSKVAWATLSASWPISLSDGVLAVAVDAPGKVSNLKASGHDERLRQAILDVLRADVRIDVVLAPERATAPAASAPSATAVESDAPSLDDPTVDAISGVDLALRELGATQIGEIEH